MTTSPDNRPLADSLPEDHDLFNDDEGFYDFEDGGEY